MLFGQHRSACADDKALRKNTKVSNVARAYSKKLADEGCIDADNAKRDSALKEALKNAGISFDKGGSAAFCR